MTFAGMETFRRSKLETEPPDNLRGKDRRRFLRLVG